MYAVIFTARVDTDDSEYGEMASRLRELALNQYGCLEFIAANEAGQEIAISYWKSQDDILAWKQDAEHQVAQSYGRERWYTSYRVQVTEVLREYEYAKDSA